MNITIDTAVSLYTLLIGVLGLCALIVKQYFTMRREIKELQDRDLVFMQMLQKSELKEQELNTKMTSMSESIVALKVTIDFFIQDFRKQR